MVLNEKIFKIKNRSDIFCNVLSKLLQLQFATPFPMQKSIYKDAVESRNVATDLEMKLMLKYFRQH